MIAFGIQLSIDANCNGVVVFEAKQTSWNSIISGILAHVR